jgi:hypothetical protein
MPRPMFLERPCLGHLQFAITITAVQQPHQPHIYPFNSDTHQPIHQHASSTWRSRPSQAYCAHRKARNHCARPGNFSPIVHCCSPTCSGTANAATGSGSYASGTRSVWTDGFDCCVSHTSGLGPSSRHFTQHDTNALTVVSQSDPPSATPSAAGSEVVLHPSLPPLLLRTPTSPSNTRTPHRCSRPVRVALTSTTSASAWTRTRVA